MPVRHEQILSALDKLQHEDYLIAVQIAKSLREIKSFSETKAIQAYSVTGELIRETLPKSLTEILTTDETCTVATLRKYRGEDVALGFLRNEMKKLASFFSVGKGISEAGIARLAQLLFDKYHYFKIADWRFFAKRALSCDFGKAYDRFDAPTVMGWAEVYANDRMIQAATIAQGNKNKAAKETTGGIGQMPKTFQDFANSHTAKNPIERERLAKPNPIAISKDPVFQRYTSGSTILNDPEYLRRKAESENQI
jgi:hypothetical protein